MSETEVTRSRLGVIKFIELLLSVGCAVLHYYSFNDGDLVTEFLSTGTFCGFIAILITIFFSFLMKTPINKRLDIFYSVLGCSMFILSGILIIQAWEHSFRTRTRDLAITKASVAIINGIVFLFDGIFTFREK